MMKLLFYLSLLASFGVGLTIPAGGEEFTPQGLQASPVFGPEVPQALTTSDPELPRPSRSGDHLDQGNDACPATAIPGLPYSDTGTTAGRANNWNTAASCSPGGSTAPDVIYSLIPDFPGQEILISTCGSAFNTLLEVRTGGACPGTTQIACADAGCGSDAELRIVLPTTDTYYVIVDGYGTLSGSYTLLVEEMCELIWVSIDGFECSEDQDSSHARLDCNGGPCNVAFGGVAGYTEIHCGGAYAGYGFTYTRADVNHADTDWYRFTISEPCTVKITLETEFPAVLSGGAIIGTCSYHTTTVGVYTCEPYTLVSPNVPAGEWEFTVNPWDGAGLPVRRPYRVELECIPLSGCRIDNTLNEIGTITSSTFGAINNCALATTEDRTYRINLTNPGLWTISLCDPTPGWDPQLYLSTVCCDAGSVIASATGGCTVPWIPELYNLDLDAGTYYVTVEGQGAEFNAGDFTLELKYGCMVDDTLFAPGTISGNTCGEGVDCPMHHGTSEPGEDQLIRVVIPTADDYTFRLDAAFGMYEILMRECCGEYRSMSGSVIHCLPMEAGECFIKIDATAPDCGPWTLTVEVCRNRCCYGEDYLMCADLAESVCDSLGGAYDYDRNCTEDPCLVVPLCPAASYYGQHPTAPDGYMAMGITSDLYGAILCYEDFQGIPAPIANVRFWGFHAGADDPCFEDPMPLTVQFRQWDGYREPGAIVATYSDSLYGTPGDMYTYAGTLYEYNLPLSPPLALDSGWFSVYGAGDPDCDFTWALSQIGNGSTYTYHWDDEAFHSLGDRRYAFCLGGCPQPDSLTLKYNSGINFTLSFWAPIDAEYRMYFTTSMTAEYPTGWSLAGHPDLTAGHYDYSINLASFYQRWLVVANCE